ncbi:MAG: polysaccharide biosynthesis/export family protein [Pseudomonadota bacterium]
MIKRLILAIVATMFATAALAQEGYRIKAGDTLAVEVLEDPTLGRQVLVLPDGSISFPLAGSVRASGQTTGSVQQAIASAIAPNFAAPPTVFVSVAQVAEAPVVIGGGGVRTPDTMSVFVMGEVGNPGELQVAPGTTILQALAQTGGFSKFAATKRIQLRRTDPATGEEQIYNINYQAVESGQSSIGRSPLAAGDVIVVPQRRFFE